MDILSPVPPLPPVVGGHRAPTDLRSAGAAATAAAPAGDVAVDFEAAMLSPLVEQMLPPADSPVWGGKASSVWRGLFAQELADQLARSGGVGLADTVARALALPSDSEAPQ